jgi:hypothetical protein
LARDWVGSEITESYPWTASSPVVDEDLDAHTVGDGWRRHVVRGDGEDDVFGVLGSQGGVELLSAAPHQRPVCAVRG